MPERSKIIRIAATVIITVLALGLVSGIVFPCTQVIVGQTGLVTNGSPDPSVSYTPLGLNGAVTSNILVGKVTDDGENTVFLGTSNGLYVIGPDGELQHFLYSPFGVAYVTLLDDISGDGVRDILVVLQNADVPMICCYDGATWQKIWQFSPGLEFFKESWGWVEVQFPITDLKITHEGDSQNIMVTTDRSLFCVRGKDGRQLWRFEAPSALGKMAVVTAGGGDADAIVVGSQDGFVYLLNGGTGKVRWEERLEEQTYNSPYGPSTFQPTVHDVVTVDDESGKVAVASSDGKVRLLDVRAKRYDWEVTIAEYNGSEEYLNLSLAPDINADSLPDLVVTNPPSPSNVVEEMPVVLLDSTGNKAWEKKLYLWPLMGAEVASINGKPAILETKDQELRIIDLASGEPTQTIKIETLDSQAPMVKKLDEGSYLLVSAGSDLAAISSSGEVLWSYPRIGNIRVKTGDFTGDGTPDTLFCAECGQSNTYTESSGYSYNPEAVPEDPVRLLSVMDGVTHEMLWSYKIPCHEFMVLGGLRGVQVVPDIVGNDGLQDIIGYGGDSVFIFSGKDGNLSHFSIGENITSLDIIQNGAAGSAIAVGILDGLDIFSVDGVQLWNLHMVEPAEGDGQGVAEFKVLDDINGDGVGDLAVFYANRIEVLRSVGGMLSYESHLTFEAGEGKSIEFKAMVPDVDKDGVREMAYFENPVTPFSKDQQAGYPVLLVCSPVDGTILLRADRGWRPVWNLACADFNGDGYADSMVCWQPYDVPGSSGAVPGLQLEIFSGKDGKSLWLHTLETSYPGAFVDTMPAIPMRDINGDGAEDLVLITGAGYQNLERTIVVYDVLHDAVLKEIPVGGLMGKKFGVMLYESVLEVRDDLLDSEDAALIVRMSEEGPVSGSLGYYNPISLVTRECIGIVEMGDGAILTSFRDIDPQYSELFDAYQPGLLGVAASGGVCFLKATSDLKVTSPTPGSRTGSRLGVSWEGTKPGDFTEVYVDGIRNRMSNGTEASLLVKPGEHELMLRSVDEWGRISYATGSFQAARSIWDYMVIPLVVVVLLGLLFPLAYPRLAMTRRRRRHQRMTK